MHLIKVGVIGSGFRSTAYLGEDIPDDVRPSIRVVALADPDEDNRRFVKKTFKLAENAREYGDHREMLNNEPLDAIIIASPNYLHTAHLIDSLALGVPILLEKPVATTLEDCERLWKAYQRSNRPPVVVGFVLRYAPFYKKIMELVRSGQLGELLSVDADELLSASQVSVFFRGGWRRMDRFSGGFLLEKCCHDLDILHAVVQSRVKQVYSLGQRSHFISRPRAEQHRRFDLDVVERLSMDYESPATRRWLQSFSTENVYGSPSDVPDHQSVILEFENGVISCFTACFAQPRPSRRIRIYGSNGSLSGDLSHQELYLDRPFADQDKAELLKIAISEDGSGHSGADRTLNHVFWSHAARGDNSETLASLEEGIEAVIVALAAEKSRGSNSPVGVESIRKMIFGDSFEVETCSLTMS